MRKLILVLAVGAIVAVGALAWSSMSGGDGIDVRPPDVEVDTPALREAKQRIGMEQCVPGDGEPVEGGLPEMTLPCLGGGPDVDLSSLRGPMVINMWASWCGPCRKEMPALESFHQDYGDQVAVLGLDVNDVYPERALALAEETGATYPSLVDVGGEVFAEKVLAVARAGVPAFVYVAADGTVTASTNGGVDSVAEIKANVAEHLGITL